MRLIKELDAEGTIKTPLNGCSGTLVGVIFYGPNSQSGDKYKSTHNCNTNTHTNGGRKIQRQIQLAWYGMDEVIYFSRNSLSGNRQLIHRRHEFT